MAKDGAEVWVHDQARLIVDDEGRPRYWQGVLVDITHQKRAEALEQDLAQERESTERLRTADEMKNTFLRAVSHDLRTPLAAILGLAATLERSDLDLPEQEANELAGRIVVNARRLDRMVSDMLDLDRLSRGVIEPAFQPVDVGHLVRELVANSGLVSGRRLQLDTAPISVPADAMMVERIVENLIGNTVKHTPGDSRIWVRVERVDVGVMVTVEDDGPGVDPQDRRRIFEVFAQGASGDAAPGVGLGLALVARFAELHGGQAWVQERAGGGASFRVTLAEVPPRLGGDREVADADPWTTQADRPAVAGSSPEASQA
jgi:signal transduction histidine kinase